MIRPLTAADRAVHLDMRGRLWSAPRNEHEAELGALETKTSFTAFGAFAGERAVGFAEATFREFVPTIGVMPAVYLEGIWVEEGYRRRGIATALVRAVEAWALLLGCSDIASDALLDNTDSQAWHRCQGFAELNQTVNFAKKIRPDP